MVLSGWFFLLHLLVPPNTMTLGTLVALDAWFCGPPYFLKKETKKTFDDVRWVLTITRVAPECRDTVGPACLCHDTWPMSVLTDVTTRDMRKCTRDRSSLADLHPTYQVAPRH
jgi:hypothetical protein